MNPISRKGGNKFLIFSLFLFALACIIFLSPLKNELTPKKFKQLADRLSGLPLFPLLYGAATAIGTWLMLPSFAFIVAAGLIFSPLPGIAVTWPAVTAGALLAFISGRTFLHDFIQRHIHRVRVLSRLNESTKHNGFLFSLIARLILIVPWNIFNYAASLTSVSWKSYTAGTALGILPAIIVMSLLGSAVKRARKQPEALIIPITCNIIIMISAILVKRKLWKNTRQ